MWKINFQLKYLFEVNKIKNVWNYFLIMFFKILIVLQTFSVKCLIRVYSFYFDGHSFRGPFFAVTENHEIRFWRILFRCKKSIKRECARRCCTKGYTCSSDKKNIFFSWCQNSFSLTYYLSDLSNIPIVFSIFFF